MTTNFQINGVDFDDTYVKRDIFVEGGLWGWGYNFLYQLADGTTSNRSSPVQTIVGGSDWKQLSSTVFHNGIIKGDGSLWLWGINDVGQLGDNTRTNRISPIQTVSAGNNWKQCSVGQISSAAIKTDGTLWTWGWNFKGILGDNTTTHRSSPVQTVAGGSNWKQVAMGAMHAAAVKTDGTLWTWGNNIDGALGDNSTTNRSSPVQTVSAGTNWKQVACGGRDGETGGGGLPNYSFTAAIKTDGTLWTWGDNTYGQLGDNSVTKKSSPVQTVAGGTNWKQVSSYIAAGAIKTDGTLWMWGDNTYGQLGDNTTTHRSSPVQTVAGGTNWKQIAAGQIQTGSIKNDGTLWTWGANGSGQLGDNTRTHRSSPVQIMTGGTNWSTVASGSQHMMGIRENTW